MAIFSLADGYDQVAFTQDGKITLAPDWPPGEQSFCHSQPVADKQCLSQYGRISGLLCVDKAASAGLAYFTEVESYCCLKIFR